MKILVFSPLEMPFTIGARYTGLERLAVQFAEQFHKLGYSVTLMAHKDTTVPEGVKLLPCEGREHSHGLHTEHKAFMNYQSEFRKYDAIWDITHLHLPARIMIKLPIVNIFHANPEYAFHGGYIKAPYNLISWSRWGIGQIAKYYCGGQPCINGGQKAVYQETIMVDPDLYKPLGKRSDRFLTLGRMGPEKGNLNAVMLCKNLGLPLDVAGGRGSEHTGGDVLTDYERSITDLCDGKQIRFLGEVSDEQKIGLMQECRALLYMTNHVEITSHKVQEALLCGAPVIVPRLGGIPEIVTNGVDGFLCTSQNDYETAIKNVDRLDPSLTRKYLVQKFAPKNVAEGYVNLLKKVTQGGRW